MAEPPLDVYLTGELSPGVDADTAAQRLAQLFKAPPETMRNLLHGRPQILKRGLDRHTAERYCAALEGAGVAAALRPAGAAKPDARHAADAVPGKVPVRPAIRADASRTGAPLPATPTANSASAMGQTSTPAGKPGWQLRPPGTDLLTPQERHAPTAAIVDTSHLQLCPADSDVLTAAERQRRDGPTVTAGNFSLAPTGSNLGAVVETEAAMPPPAQRYTEFTLAPADGHLLTTAEKAAPAPPRSLGEAASWRLDPPG